MKMIFISIIASLALSTCGTGRSQAAAVASVDSFVELDTENLADEPKAVVEWDKTVHDFGDVSVSDGPLSCCFTLTNKGTEAIAIFEVVSSCGCTGVDFPKSKIEPGQSATISATYKNEDGPTAFDKTLRRETPMWPIRMTPAFRSGKATPWGGGRMKVWCQRSRQRLRAGLRTVSISELRPRSA